MLAPLAPCEVARLRKLHGKRENMRMPRLAEHAFGFAGGACSAMLEIGFVQVERDRIAGVTLLAPQLARAEAHGVEMLRVLVAIRAGVRRRRPRRDNG